MKKHITFLFYFWAVFFSGAYAQTFYVDANLGNDSNIGTLETPFQSIGKAVARSNSLAGSGEIVIKLLPGIYTLEDKVDINPIRILSDTVRYIIEAAIMPNDESWTPEKMPVIQSVSANNSNTQFAHSTGFLVASKHVTIRGLKFLGNSNPEVDYYYPISKEDQNLEALVISQCYFIGDKEAGKIQGGVWAHGPQNKISHCIFYGCRNAILFFNNVHDFTIEYTIVANSYESACWFGREDYSFTFTNNVFINNANVLVCPKELTYSSPFSNSVIANNKSFIGYWSREEQKVIEIPSPNIKLKKIRDRGIVNLRENNQVKLEKLHLHLKEDSEGVDLGAGIF